MMRSAGWAGRLVRRVLLTVVQRSPRRACTRRLIKAGLLNAEQDRGAAHGGALCHTARRWERPVWCALAVALVDAVRRLVERGRRSWTCVTVRSKCTRRSASHRISEDQHRMLRDSGRSGQRGAGVQPSDQETCGAVDINEGKVAGGESWRRVGSASCRRGRTGYLQRDGKPERSRPGLLGRTEDCPEACCIGGERGMPRG